MKSPRFRLLLFTLATLASGSGTALADWWPYTETVYTGPAATAFALPTSYVVPSAYVVPTTAVVPTAYATAYYPTSYAWTPTAYYQTSYVPTGYYVQERVARRPLFSGGLFGRRREVDYIVPTTIYYPTTAVVPTTSRYYAPTVFEYPVLSEVRYQSVAAGCGTCDDSVVVASAPAVVDRPVVRDEPARTVEEPRRPRAVESNTFDDQSTTPSQVEPAPADREPAPIDDLDPVKQPKQANPQPSRVQEEPIPPGKDSPPTPPAAKAPAAPAGNLRSTEQPPTDTAKKGGAPGPQTGGSTEKKAPTPAPGGTDPLDPPLPLPTAPGGLDDTGLPPAEGDKSAPQTRQSMKPSLSFSRPSGLTLLKGRVRSSASAEPEQSVRVIISSRTNAFADRTVYSNEAGRFALKVPNGDWTVKVAMPSGRVYPVYQITVSDGAIIDDQGQDVPALVITR